MHYLYLDAFSGVSGDMFLGALLDLGYSAPKFQEAISRLHLPLSLEITRVKRASLQATRVKVNLHPSPSPPRTFREIEKIILNSSFSSQVKDKSLAVFENLFLAEAKVHGVSPKKAHLHEAGADDALVDILGTCFLLEELEVTHIYSSPLNLGGGFVKTAHGVLPVPPPAVAELLKGIPVYSSGPPVELVTPTGAALIKTLAKEFLAFPQLNYQRIGYGAGSRNLPEFPNLLRVFLGNQADFSPEEQIFQIETNLDEATPQLLGAFLEKALQLGACEAFLTPVTMKKNRLGTKLTILADKKNLDRLTQAIFEETTTIGLRFFPVSRYILQRETRNIEVFGEKVRVKIARFKGQEINHQPEYEDCLKIARKKRLPLKKVMEEASKKILNLK